MSARDKLDLTSYFYLFCYFST